MSDHVPIFPPPTPHVISLKPAQGQLCWAFGRGYAQLSGDLCHGLVLLESLLKEFDFRLLLKELDATPLVRALGLSARIFARPHAARPLRHQSGCKVGSVFVHPHGGLLLKPGLHALLLKPARVFFEKKV